MADEERGDRAYLQPPYRIPPRERDEILAGLNLDLMWEYAAMIQYIQHASMLTGFARQCARVPSQARRRAKRPHRE